MKDLYDFCTECGCEVDSEGKRIYFEDVEYPPLSEEELLSISETVCKFVAITRITNIDKYLFEDSELTIPKYINM